MAKAPKLLRNILNYTAGQFGMAFFGLVTGAVLARYMSKPAFGQYSYLLAVATILLPFLDGGATGFYTRASARNRDEVGRHWARAVGIRLYTLPVATSALGIYLYATGTGINGKLVLVMAYALAQSVLMSTDVAFRSQERGLSWAIRRTIYEISYLGMTLVSLAVFHLIAPAQQFLIAALAIVVGGSWAVISVFRMTNLSITDFVSQFLRPLRVDEIAKLWPFAINAALFIFYYRLTAIFLEHFGSTAELADFRVAFVVMTSALYLPKAIIWAVSPRIALHDELGNREKFNALVRKSADANLFVSAIVTTGGLLYGQTLIGLIFGAKYSHLGSLWIVIDIGMGLFFVQQFCVDVLNNLHKERHVVRALAVAVVLLTILNLLLIPRYGALGAAVARLAAGLVLVPINLRELLSLVGGRNLHEMNLLRFAGVNILAAGIGLATLSVNYWLSLVLFLLSYALLSYVAGTLPGSFRRIVGRMLRRAT